MSTQQSRIRSNAAALLTRIRACRNLERARKVHAEAVETGDHLEAFVANSLVRMFAKCGSMADARHVFDKLPLPDVASQNALIQGYAENGQGEVALELFESLRQRSYRPSSRSFVAVLKACIDLAAKEEAKLVDGRPVKSDSLGKGVEIHVLAGKLGCLGSIFVLNSLISFYAKCGSMVDARRVFDGMKQRDIVSWTSLMLGYVESGEPEMGLDLFAALLAQRDCDPDATTFVAALNACTALAAKEDGRLVDGRVLRLKSLEQGMAIHCEARKLGYDLHSVFVANSLINMYAKCGGSLDARKVFDSMTHHDVVSWNSLILGLVENSQGGLALDLFPCSSCPAQTLSFVIALKACSCVAASEDGELVDDKMVKVEALAKGMEIHSRARKLGHESEILVANALVDMYAKCGSLEDARGIFNRMPLHSLVSWTSLMLGYAENGDADQALELFALVRARGCDVRAYLAALKACGTVVSLDLARAIHEDITRAGLENSLALDTGLVDVYAKCGSLDSARRVFDAVASKDSVTWTALVAGYGRQGDTSRVFEFFHRMQDEGLRPNAVTFLCLLTACSHGGLVETGKSYFQAMEPRYGLVPGIEHYHCMLDMLGRANELESAVEMARRMPFKPNPVTWITILGACHKWKNVAVGRIAFDALVELEVGEGAVYTLMSSIYGARGMWEEQARVLEAMRRARKKPRRRWWSDQMERIIGGDSCQARCLSGKSNF
ncbi:putative pentatricopeptide repeat-containing protein At3g01580 [Selaginella moellendorffii]|uniref:putative pentatricopeptide repeat-containing protein At3g01580 n=1 Tax=Selaginella moellendorffii TaxID=88036 RepID=UPI000D1CAC33|nr:putative pentatricopeptide repeat-containing protein At3g01580 [Selaginella moellendorffii]|eukprot:XP_024537528.1 putative pentatricopeptide repeat-containing protein At3g01580 [Selaginella moellendorffii]